MSLPVDRLRRMIKVEHLLGRLVGITYASPIMTADIDAFEPALRALIEPLPRVVFVVDFYDLVVMEGELAERTTKIMKSDNPKVLKSAFLLPSSAVGSLQTGRLIREARNPLRRGFESIDELLAWLEPDLEGAEHGAAQAFFAPHA